MFVAVVTRRRRVLVNILVAAAALILPLGLILALHLEPLALGLTHASPGRAGIGVRQGLTRLDKLEFLLTGGWATGAVALTLAPACPPPPRPGLVAPVTAVGSFVCGLALVFVMLGNYTFSNENLVAFCPLALWGLLLPLIPSPYSRAAGSTTADPATGSSGPRAAFWELKLRPAPGRISGGSAGTALLWLVAVGGTPAVVTLAADSGGAQWGPRYVLFAFPLLILLALKARERMLALGHQLRLINYAFVGVLALSFLLQGLGLFALSVKQDLAARANAAVASTGTRVVVSAFPVIDVLAPTYESHRYLYAPTHSDLVTLMSRLRAGGVGRLTLLCDPINPCAWNGYAGWSHGRIKRVRHIVRFAVYTAS